MLTTFFTFCSCVDKPLSLINIDHFIFRATSPPSFALEVFVHCDGESRFRRLCQPFLYSHSSSNVLEVEVQLLILGVLCPLFLVGVSVFFLSIVQWTLLQFGSNSYCSIFNVCVILPSKVHFFATTVNLGP